MVATRVIMFGELFFVLFLFYFIILFIFSFVHNLEVLKLKRYCEVRSAFTGQMVYDTQQRCQEYFMKDVFVSYGLML